MQTKASVPQAEVRSARPPYDQPKHDWLDPRYMLYNVAVMQVGATPDGVEVPRCVIDPDCLRTIEQQLPGHRATIPPGADPKWRFFWRLGPRPAHTQFAELNAAPVIPAGAAPPRYIPKHLITPAQHLRSMLREPLGPLFKGFARSGLCVAQDSVEFSGCSVQPFLSGGR